MEVEGIDNEGIKNLMQNALPLDGWSLHVKKDPLPSMGEKTTQKKALGRDQLERILSQFEKAANRFDTQLSFILDEKTGKTIIKVIDRETGDTIRQIPPEEALKLSANMQEMIGLLFDKGV